MTEKLMLYSGEPKKEEGHILVVVKASFLKDAFTIKCIKMQQP